MRASRFDERGIALQTVIIIVVMLAIAASVAGVLLSRAGEETARLSDTSGRNAVVYSAGNGTSCSAVGGTWFKATATEAAATHADAIGVKAARNITLAVGTEYCQP